ncbi:MAG: hypothetical protein WCB90_05195 [Methanosarcina sp.]|jgi:hypothetical protein|uniref:hypothetical protein n=1 Tax=Methanosarcina sp. TaxID=2213 RepID=UPI003BB6E913
MEIVGYILAIIGLACVVKHIMHYKEGCCLCGWHKIKIEDEKPTGTTVSHKIKVEDEKQQGSRYGSNPINY